MKVWPFEVGFQKEASNHQKQRLLRAGVVSILKKSDLIWQVWIRKTNYPEPLLTRRNPETDIKTRGVYKPWDKSTGNLVIV
jgi:hypothetical protein